MSDADASVRAGVVERPYADPAHPGNRIRPRLRCIGCGTHGVVTAWGPWCFTCNVKRMDRINGRLAPVALALARASAPTKGTGA